MSKLDAQRRPLDFEDWYIGVADEVTQQICATLRDPVLGREIAAEAFARSYDKWHRVSRMDSPTGWVYRTAMNLSKRSWRRRAIERRAVNKLKAGLTALSFEIFDEVSEVKGHHPDDVADLVAELPERMQQAVRLRYWHGLSEAEVAKRMNISTGTVSATLSQARRKLEAELEANQADFGGEREQQ